MEATTSPYALVRVNEAVTRRHVRAHVPRVQEEHGRAATEIIKKGLGYNVARALACSVQFFF